VLFCSACFGLPYRLVAGVAEGSKDKSKYWRKSTGFAETATGAFFLCLQRVTRFRSATQKAYLGHGYPV
jgi:hypothetical protein